MPMLFSASDLSRSQVADSGSMTGFLALAPISWRNVCSYFAGNQKGEIDAAVPMLNWLWSLSSRGFG